MPSLREQRLQERVAEIRPQLQKARELCEKADSEHREMTAEEQKDYDDIMAKGRAVAEAVKQHRHDQEVFAIARDLSDNVIGGLDGAPGGGSMSLKGKRLSFLGMGTKAATAMLGPDDTKALAPSGAAVMGQEFVADPVALGQVAQSLWMCWRCGRTPAPSTPICARPPAPTTPAVVAEGATKPTSVYIVTRIEQSLVVVAHLSEGIPRYWLLDNTALPRHPPPAC